MSEIIDSNLSVAGDASQALSTRKKINLGLIAIGILLVLWGIYDEKTAFSYQKLAGFTAIFVGVGLFEYKFWYQNVGSALFTAGLIGMYYGYTEGGDDRYYALMGAFALMLIAAGFFTYDPSKKNYFGSQYVKNINMTQKLGTFIAMAGFSIIALSWISSAFEPAEGQTSAIYDFLMVFPNNAAIFLTISIVAMGGGILLYTFGSYAGHTKGIKNNYVMFNSLSSRGAIGWIVGIVLTVFYVQLYWHAAPLANAIDLFDPLSQLLRGKEADQWFLYGTLYTVVILFLGIKFIYKYRHSRYHLIRTIVVILSQLILAYFIPYIMESLSYNSADVLVEGQKQYGGYYSANPINSWPLNKDAFSDAHLRAYTQEAYQPVGLAYLFWGILLFLVVTPVVTYFVGKRWYCSWFCGCGGLAETAGDSFRHLSNKTVKAWNIERWVLHSVMVFILISTIAALFPYLTKKEYAIGFGSINKNSFYAFVSVILVAGAAVLFYLRATRFKKNKFLLIGGIIFSAVFLLLTIAYFSGGKEVFVIKSTSIKKAYGFFVGAAFSGVIGVGFYPILGNRVWCRFGCPMAGYMGIVQRFKSKFRITTNGAQCISCGNCSTYCEQGIDVRAYAQKGENIVRASCVGCGVCSSVCPRGVLKLENGPEDGRLDGNPLIVSKDGVKLNM
ncbi:MAG: 4Fe-4S binding protein [Crocinitomicaceae bacterium]|nr:4Fe-4S binding protein [Crocinitomicaceae bacterium]